MGQFREKRRTDLLAMQKQSAHASEQALNLWKQGHSQGQHEARHHEFRSAELTPAPQGHYVTNAQLQALSRLNL